MAVNPLCIFYTFAFIKMDANIAKEWKYCRIKYKDGKHMASL